MYKKRALLFVISILLLAALFFTIDYNEFFRITSKISLKWVLMLVFIQLLIMFLGSVKWYVLVRRYAISFMNVFHTSLIGLMVNSVTPVGLAGGEPVKAYVISKIDKIKMEHAFATILVDLFLNIIPVLFLDLIAIFLAFKYSVDLSISGILALIGLFVLALIVSSFSIFLNHKPSLNLLKILLDVFGRFPPLKKQVKKIELQVDVIFLSFQRSIHTTMTDLRTLTVATVISMSIWVLTLLRVYLIFIALGIDIEFEVVIIVYAVLIMVSMIPFLPGALGLWEWIGVALFTFFGLPLAASTAIVVIDRLLFYWLPIFTGFISSLHVGLNVMRLLDRVD